MKASGSYSMKKFVPFLFDEHEVRVFVDGDDNVWFAGKDVASVLGYTNSAKAVGDHCKYMKILKNNDSLLSNITIPSRGLQIIPKSDVYRLIMRSKLPSAERFQDFVVEEILPSVEEKSGYVMSGRENVENFVKTFMGRLDESTQITVIGAMIEEMEDMKEKTALYDHYCESDGYMGVAECAKSLAISGLGRNTLYMFMRDMKIVQSSESSWNIPYQRYINSGYFVVKDVWAENKGEYVKTTLVTRKGQDWLYRKLIQNGAVENEDGSLMTLEDLKKSA